MKYLVDANVLSEATRSDPNPAVVRWIEEHEPVLAIDAIVLAELAVGVEGLAKGGKRERLEEWFRSLTETIECLSWDAAAGAEWARLVVDLRRRGRAMPLFDSMIAATARAHSLAVVTRNVRDFEHAGVEVVNPFPGQNQADSGHETDGEYGD